MRFGSVLVSGTFALTAYAAALAGHVGCLAPSLTDEQRHVHKQLAASEKRKMASADSVQSFANVNVPTYVHVVSASQSASDGYLSVSMPFNEQPLLRR